MLYDPSHIQTGTCFSQLVATIVSESSVFPAPILSDIVTKPTDRGSDVPSCEKKGRMNFAGWCIQHLEMGGEGRESFTDSKGMRGANRPFLHGSGSRSVLGHGRVDTHDR